MRQVFDLAGQFVVYTLLVLTVNSLQPVFAANLDADYKDAVTIFEKRDVVSCGRAITALEKILSQKADHLDAQALISYAYAHEAFVMTQLGEKATEYQNSADAFAKAVLAQQPQNIYARKTMLFLQLVAGNENDARKILERDVTESQSDADMWYLLAIVSDGENSGRALSKALSLNPDHVWIYADMAFRAVKAGDLVIAEKWAKALELRRAGAVSYTHLTLPTSDLV